MSPLVDEGRSFTVPFRPYDWTSYPGVSLGPPLLQQGLRPSSLEVDGLAGVGGGGGGVSFYIDRSRSSLYAERASCEDPYGDYGPPPPALIFPDRGLKAQPPSELLCPGLMLNSAYKCVKCTKVSATMDPRTHLEGVGGW